MHHKQYFPVIGNASDYVDAVMRHLNRCDNPEAFSSYWIAAQSLDLGGAAANDPRCQFIADLYRSYSSIPLVRYSFPYQPDTSSPLFLAESNSSYLDVLCETFKRADCYLLLNRLGDTIRFSRDSRGDNIPSLESAAQKFAAIRRSLEATR